MATMPVDRGFVVTSPFGARWGTTHWGVDFGVAGGSGGKPIYAVKDGVINRAGPASGFGQWITQDHDANVGGGTSVYGHIIPEKPVGYFAREGERIGHINPNQATNGGVAPHLHYEFHRYVWVPPGGDRLDPMETVLRGAVWPGESPPRAPQPVQPAFNEGLTAENLMESMKDGNGYTRLGIDRYRELLPHVVKAMNMAEVTTPKRAAMFLAQIGHESSGLFYMQEIADGSAYEWRQDLGNTQAGWGRRYKGRGPIQVTGARNYRVLSEWAYSKGYVNSPTYFFDNPAELEKLEYGFLGAVWYWTTQRPLNTLSDNGDVVGATRAINGGTNGLQDRQNRYSRCVRLGNKIIPGTTSEVEEIGNMNKIIEYLSLLLDQLAGPKAEDGRRFFGWNIHSLYATAEEKAFLNMTLPEYAAVTLRDVQALTNTVRDMKTQLDANTSAIQQLSKKVK